MGAKWFHVRAGSRAWERWDHPLFLFPSRNLLILSRQGFFFSAGIKNRHQTFSFRADERAHSDISLSFLLAVSVLGNSGLAPPSAQEQPSSSPRKIGSHRGHRLLLRRSHTSLYVCVSVCVFVQGCDSTRVLILWSRPTDLCSSLSSELISCISRLEPST